MAESQRNGIKQSQHIMLLRTLFYGVLESARIVSKAVKRRIEEETEKTMEGNSFS
jgi:hypothetical protein